MPVSPYAYVLNNPVSLTDPDGRDVHEGEDGWTFTGSEMMALIGYLESGGSYSDLVSNLENGTLDFGNGPVNAHWGNYNPGPTWVGRTWRNIKSFFGWKPKPIISAGLVTVLEEDGDVFLDGEHLNMEGEYPDDWGIPILDDLTETFIDMYNSYEFYIEGDNHILWGPQIALEGKIEGVGVGFAYGENMVEDNLSSAGVPGTIHRDELSGTLGLFGFEYIDRKDATAGNIISSSRSGSLGPFSKTITDGKTSYSIGASLRAGMILINAGFKLSGEIGIREK